MTYHTAPADQTQSSADQLPAFLIRLLGRPLLFLLGDSAVWDRYRWLRARLPKTRDNLRLLDVGCGSGQFTIEAAARGYDATGLTWDDNANAKATSRAVKAGASAKFVPWDARQLGSFEGQYEIIINFENIEHILDDQRLMNEMSRLLTPGGLLLQTTPHYFFPPMSPDDAGPHLSIEDGRHVRRGYTEARLRQMAERAGLVVEEVSFCTGPCSRRVITATRALRSRATIILSIPFKILANAIDEALGLTRRNHALSIAIVYQKLP